MFLNYPNYLREACTYGRMLGITCVRITVPSRQIHLRALLNKNNTIGNEDTKAKRLTASSTIHHMQLKTANSDLFGTLDGKLEQSVDLDDNDGETEFLAKISDTGRPRPFDYLNQIEQLLKPPNVDIRQALEILEVDMKREYVKPIPEIYRVLIHACGNKGYSDKAFELYRSYTSRRFPVNHGIFSDLFNSCANCPKDESNGAMKARALRNATNLYHKINSSYSGHLHPVLFHNMIKAFGKCGEIEYAFDLLDKMGEKRVRVSASTICHVLHACINDKESGLRHALLLWRKMRQFKIEPNVQCYNLLLRVVKDCGVGDPQYLQDILLEAMSSKDVRKLKRTIDESKFIESNHNKDVHLINEKLSDSQCKVKQIHIHSDEICKDSDVKDREICDSGSDHKQSPITNKASEVTVLPNFLSPKPNFDCNYGIIGLSENYLQTTQNKFSLFGNVTEFLNLMVSVDHVQPDIKTISQLLHCIDHEDEYLLLKCIKKYNVITDVDFFNQLMRKRIARYDYSSARDTLQEMNDFDVAPDIATFGCLAMTCNSDKLSLKLLKDMNTNGIKPNVQIVTALLNNACRRYSFSNVHILLNVMSRENIHPTKQTIATLEHFYAKCREMIVTIDKSKDSDTKGLNESFFGYKILKEDIDNGSKLWRKHVIVYTKWLERTEIEYPSHPWKQFLTSKDIEQAKTGTEMKKNYIKQIIDNT